MSAAKIQFSVGSVVLTSKLIDGTFPDYERVIPKDNDKALEVDTKLFSQAVDRVSTISAEKGRAIKLNLEADKIVLTVNNPDSGSAEEEVAAGYASDPIEIGFNSRYLLDIAKPVRRRHGHLHAIRRGLAHSGARRTRTTRPSMYLCRCGYSCLTALNFLAIRGFSPHMMCCVDISCSTARFCPSQRFIRARGRQRFGAHTAHLKPVQELRQLAPGS